MYIFMNEISRKTNATTDGQCIQFEGLEGYGGWGVVKPD